ncbi:hypothetical protein TNCV_1894091 [Trichonephila clavipes]|nr:hypothetical protein TNCV_1894091 [Trichonephila clavipes]
MGPDGPLAFLLRERVQGRIAKRAIIFHWKQCEIQVACGAESKLGIRIVIDDLRFDFEKPSERNELDETIINDMIFVDLAR